MDEIIAGLDRHRDALRTYVHETIEALFLADRVAISSRQSRRHKFSSESREKHTVTYTYKPPASIRCQAGWRCSNFPNVRYGERSFELPHLGYSSSRIRSSHLGPRRRLIRGRARRTFIRRQPLSSRSREFNRLAAAVASFNIAHLRRLAVSLSPDLDYS